MNLPRSKCSENSLTSERETSNLPDTDIDRRGFLKGATAVLMAGLTAEVMTQEIGDAKKARKDASKSDPGPENQAVREANPNTFEPPVTDHGETPSIWNSFSVAHRRVPEGGWSRQITVSDFPLSKDIAGVNMRLTAGGIRELDWHDAAEWAIMLSGNARITAIDNYGKSFASARPKATAFPFRRRAKTHCKWCREGGRNTSEGHCRRSTSTYHLLSGRFELNDYGNCMKCQN